MLKWPNREIVVGYVGRAKVGGPYTDYDSTPYTDEWLRDFISRNLNTELWQLAHNLKSDLESELQGQVTPDDGMILHLGGFVKVAGQWKPQVWYVRNTTIDSKYLDVKAEFDVSEEIDSLGKFPGWTGNQIRTKVDQMARDWNPFWFRQGFDLATFHMLDATIRQGMPDRRGAPRSAPPIPRLTRRVEQAPQDDDPHLRCVLRRLPFAVPAVRRRWS